VPVFRDALEVTTLGDKIDIIFDLTGNSRVRQELRLKLIENPEPAHGHRHRSSGAPVVALLRAADAAQGHRHRVLIHFAGWCRRGTGIPTQAPLVAVKAGASSGRPSITTPHGADAAGSVSTAG